MGADALVDEDEGEDDEGGEPKAARIREVPFEYLLGRAAHVEGVPSWVMAKQSIYWMGLALARERIDQRAQAIADKIAEARRKKKNGDEDDEDENGPEG